MSMAQFRALHSVHAVTPKLSTNIVLVGEGEALGENSVSAKSPTSSPRSLVPWATLTSPQMPLSQQKRHHKPVSPPSRSDTRNFMPSLSSVSNRPVAIPRISPGTPPSRPSSPLSHQSFLPMTSVCPIQGRTLEYSTYLTPFLPRDRGDFLSSHVSPAGRQPTSPSSPDSTLRKLASLIASPVSPIPAPKRPPPSRPVPAMLPSTPRSPSLVSPSSSAQKLELHSNTNVAIASVPAVVSSSTQTDHSILATELQVQHVHHCTIEGNPTRTCPPSVIDVRPIAGCHRSEFNPSVDTPVIELFASDASFTSHSSPRHHSDHTPAAAASPEDMQRLEEEKYVPELDSNFHVRWRAHAPEPVSPSAVPPSTEFTPRSRDQLAKARNARLESLRARLASVTTMVSTAVRPCVCLLLSVDG